jgi:hypothetical protein
MWRNPLVNFHRSAEAAGYPAMLIVALVCLGVVVAPVALLGVTRAGWVLAVALLSLALAVAILAAEIGAALGDADQPDAGRTAGSAHAEADRDGPASLPVRSEPGERHDARRTAA